MSATPTRCTQCTYESTKPAEFVTEPGFATICVWCQDRNLNHAPERDAYQLTH